MLFAWCAARAWTRTVTAHSCAPRSRVSTAAMLGDALRTVFRAARTTAQQRSAGSAAGRDTVQCRQKHINTYRNSNTKHRPHVQLDIIVPGQAWLGSPHCGNSPQLRLALQRVLQNLYIQGAFPFISDQQLPRQTFGPRVLVQSRRHFVGWWRDLPEFNVLHPENISTRLATIL